MELEFEWGLDLAVTWWFSWDHPGVGKGKLEVCEEHQPLRVLIVAKAERESENRDGKQGNRQGTAAKTVEEKPGLS